MAPLFLTFRPGVQGFAVKAMRLLHDGNPLSGVVSASIEADIADRKAGIGPSLLMNVRKKMKNLIDRVKTALRNHARYIATRNEIARLPLDVALDLGLFRGDAEQIASKAVWN